MTGASDGDTGSSFPLTAADDSYTHQAVAPAAATAYADSAWAERCWHVINLGDGWMAGAGIRDLWAIQTGDMNSS